MWLTIVKEKTKKHIGNFKEDDFLKMSEMYPSNNSCDQNNLLNEYSQLYLIVCVSDEVAYSSHGGSS